MSNLKVQPKQNALRNNNLGKIIVICGPMFAGKSEELLRQIKRLQYANVPYLIFKPVVDIRFDKKIKSRDGRELDAIIIKNCDEIFEHLETISSFPFVVAFDEAQFFDKKIVTIVKSLAALKITVIISGLDTDFHYEPFGPMGDLLAIADEIKKLHAVCIKCGGNATRTYRIPKKNVDMQNQILIGDKEIYQARCNNCFLQKNKVAVHLKPIKKMIQKTRQKNFKKQNGLKNLIIRNNIKSKTYKNKKMV